MTVQKGMVESSRPLVDSSSSPVELRAALTHLEASGLLPGNIGEWAKRNLDTCEDHDAAEIERRHARAAVALVLSIDWGDGSKTLRSRSVPKRIDPVKARSLLDRELYGLQEVKQRVLETIVQMNRTHTVPAYGMLLVGPAGTGKSRIAACVAHLLGRPYAIIDMSAIRDVEAITGSPRLYANARPGMIMQTLAAAGSPNVVFIVNELDKIGETAQGGNPSYALLSLLDHMGFIDNYLECSVPTEGIYVIGTANDASTISSPVLSRLSVIDVPDYTFAEKEIILRDFALPRVLERLGMKPDECTVSDAAVTAIVERYSGLPGARELEQEAEHLASHALYRIEAEGIDSVHYDIGNLP